MIDFSQWEIKTPSEAKDAALYLEGYLHGIKVVEALPDSNLSAEEYPINLLDKAIKIYNNREYVAANYFQDKEYGRIDIRCIKSGKFPIENYVRDYIDGLIWKIAYSKYLVEEMGSHTNVYLSGLIERDIDKMIIHERVGKEDISYGLSIDTKFLFIYK